jgi:hypothetical protein
LRILAPPTGVEPLYNTLRFGTSERQAASARSSACSHAVIAASVNFDFLSAGSQALCLAPASIQNISGLPQGPAGTFQGNLGVR